MRMAQDHPLLGVGAGHFPVKYGTDYRPPGHDRTSIPWSNAHSIYFLVLGELGFPGLLFLVAMILGNIWANTRLARAQERSSTPGYDTGQRLMVCLSSSMIAFAVGGAFLSAIYYPHLFVLAGLMIAGRKVLEDLAMQQTVPEAEKPQPEMPLTAHQDAT
jgi:O-antigen ligase